MGPPGTEETVGELVKEKGREVDLSQGSSSGKGEGKRL